MHANQDAICAEMVRLCGSAPNSMSCSASSHQTVCPPFAHLKRRPEHVRSQFDQMIRNSFRAVEHARQQQQSFPSRAVEVLPWCESCCREQPHRCATACRPRLSALRSWKNQRHAPQCGSIEVSTPTITSKRPSEHKMTLKKARELCKHNCRKTTS